ncbi:MAG TPA: carbonic anhydrase [Spirochaetota bacterium]|nr:carbonic anhydrase [Spirochaetota bacterium]HOM37671.1 carbonic anhydrase [Spirochaetota bacterium]HPQ49629.1 carbonic anhydrase [Spirochaetota bacterium]
MSDDIIKKIMQNNKEFVEEAVKNDPYYFKKLSEGQKPSILYIGCSDSRMPITSFTKTMPGDIFIHRNIGNQVFTNDINILSVLEYAVEVLNIKYIVIAGHYQCGAVQSAIKGVNNPLTSNWISTIRELYLENKEEIEKMNSFDNKADYLSELNVIYQIKRLLKTSIMKNRLKKKPYPLIIGWIIDIYTGYIKELPLPIDIWKKLELLPFDY